MTYRPLATRYPLHRPQYGNWIALAVLAMFFAWWIA